MFILFKRASFAPEFNIPAEICCNCGKCTDELDFYETPLTNKLNLGIYNKEITILNDYPYCKDCYKSSSREKIKFFEAVLVILMGFLVLNLFVKNNFYFSMIVPIFIFFIYFSVISKVKNGRLYTQPVILKKLKFKGDSITNISLTFYNKKYAKLFELANLDLVNSGALKIYTIN